MSSRESVGYSCGAPGRPLLWLVLLECWSEHRGHPRRIADALALHQLATALATYITKESFVEVDYATSNVDSSLVDEVESFGFDVTVGGVGSTFFNVGDNGEAFGMDDGEEVQIIDLLLATDARTSEDGLLYDLDADGILDMDEQSLRAMANDIYSAINET